MIYLRKIRILYETDCYLYTVLLVKSPSFLKKKFISYWFFVYRKGTKGTTGLQHSLREFAMTIFRNDNYWIPTFVGMTEGGM